MSAPILTTGKANSWTVAPDYSTALSENDGSAVTTVKGAVVESGRSVEREPGPVLYHKLDISPASTMTLTMDRSLGAQLPHNEARESWVLTIFEHPIGDNETVLVTTPAVPSVYRWQSQEHSTIQIDGVFDQVAGRQSVLIREDVNMPTIGNQAP